MEELTDEQIASIYKAAEKKMIEARRYLEQRGWSREDDYSSHLHGRQWKRERSPERL